MFKSNTLFILGAGASKAYGYPLGKELIEDILKDMSDDIYIPKYDSSGKHKRFWNDGDVKRNLFYEFDQFDRKLEEFDLLTYEKGKSNLEIYKPNGVNFESQNFFHQTQIRQIDIFRQLEEALRDFDPISIDAFIRDNPSHAIAGKMMILYSLLKRENKRVFQKIVGKSNLDNWYSFLLEDLVSGCADDPAKLNKNNIKFITFNYDLSLDYYLKSRIKEIEIFQTTLEKSVSIGNFFLENLDMHHVYGKLYSLEDSETYGKYFQSKQINNKIEEEDFKRFTFSFKQHKNIKTMHDERNSIKGNLLIETHKKLIRWAEEIIFIGFGFDRDNLDILGFPDKMSDYKKIFSGKTIRYLNYQGGMRSLSKEYEKIAKECHVNVTESTAVSICAAYQNDFKKRLLR